MKNTATIVLLLIFICGNVIAKCTGRAWIYVYNDGIIAAQYWNITSTLSFNAIISSSDSVIVDVRGDSQCNSTLLMMHNADTLWSAPIAYNPGYMLTITDTGHYYMHYVSSIADWDWGFDVSYFSANGINGEAAASILIYPTLSMGIFKIKSSSTNLKQLKITDYSGRLVLSSTKKFSEIDLTSFSPGIYFFAIMDEKKNVFLGRIVKQ